MTSVVYYGTAITKSVEVNTIGTNLITGGLPLHISSSVVRMPVNSEFNVGHVQVGQHLIGVSVGVTGVPLARLQFDHDGTSGALTHGPTGFAFVDDNAYVPFKVGTLEISATDINNNPTDDSFAIQSRFGRLELQHSRDGTFMMFAGPAANMQGARISGGSAEVTVPTTLNAASFGTLQLGTTQLWRLQPSATGVTVTTQTEYGPDWLTGALL